MRMKRSPVQVRRRATVERGRDSLCDDEVDVGDGGAWVDETETEYGVDDEPVGELEAIEQPMG
jgi:hypothetical protein